LIFIVGLQQLVCTENITCTHTRLGREWLESLQLDQLGSFYSCTVTPIVANV
jgi:hypothetical protein